MSRYSDAVDDGYDGPPPGSKRRQKGCGGYAAWRGHCGATDCPTCYPGSWDSEDSEELDEEVSDELGALTEQLAKAEAEAEASGWPEAAVKALWEIHDSIYEFKDEHGLFADGPCSVRFTHQKANCCTECGYDGR